MIYNYHLKTNLDYTYKIPAEEYKIFSQLELDYKISKTYANDDIKLAEALYLSENNELFVADSGLNKISVFDVQLNFKRQFGNSIVKEPKYLVINEDSNSSLFGILFASETNTNVISIWNSNEGEFINEINIDSPGMIKFNNDNMFVVSHTIFEKVKNENGDYNFEKIIKGANCIFILNVNNYEIIRKIQLEDWIAPCGLHFDSFNNLLTTSFLRNSNNTFTNCRFLIVFDKNMNYVSKTDIGEISDINDFVAIQNKILFLGNVSLNVLEFE
jgi:hypothetical protein